MGKSYVKDGTPVGSVSLCRTCVNAHIITGYRESELVQICTNVGPNVVLSFPVHACTGYYDKQRPSYKQMQDLAIDVTPAPMKPVGFKTGVGFTQKVGSPEEEDEDDVA